MFLRKRVWYNPLLHLNYDDTEVGPVIAELVEGKFVKTDDELLVEQALKMTDNNEATIVSDLYEFLSSLNVQKLNEIAKVVNLRSRNCPAAEVEVVETSPSINPFYGMSEDELSQLLSSRFSTLMVSEVIPKNKKRFRNFISKRDVVYETLLFLSCTTYPLENAAKTF